jgi:flavocytochrome c
MSPPSTGRKLLGLSIAGLAVVVLAVSLARRRTPPAATLGAVGSSATPTPDAIVVGAGIAGLSAAYELAKGGARVLVVDIASVFGGHAVMATGDLCIVGTPYQESQGAHDTADIAYGDFMAWGEDANPDWARYYVDHSREEIYDWLVSLGVTFEALVSPAGNSVRRTHRTKGRGIGVVSPIYAECLKLPGITFAWNTRVERLLTDGRRVVGVAMTNVRTDAKSEARAAAVVLATGGFQSNLDMVRESWPHELRFPERLLIGSGINSLGSGHKIARAVGADLTRMDHQWNYITGLPDPRFPGTERGLNAYNVDSVWLNSDGKRFIAERSSPKSGFPALVAQKGSTYWSIFDESAKHAFWVAGSDWGSFDVIERLIFGNADLVKSAGSLAELAEKVGLPAPAVTRTVEHYNAMVEKGVDTEFGRFGPGKPYQPKKIAQAPFYAVQFFPLTRKSMGGVAVDTSCRVLDTNHETLPGLFAAGELTGLAGINGKAGLEGTFLGPSIVTGRVAGRAALASIGNLTERAAPVPRPGNAAVGSDAGSTPLCLSCHNLPELVTQRRAGYWHFENVHKVVLARGFDCVKCHAELSPAYMPDLHRIDRFAQIQVCRYCHLGEDR